MFKLQKLKESNAVTERLEDKLLLALEHMHALHQGLSLKDKDIIKVKITGDGTTCGKRLKVTNIGFVVIIGQFISIDHILAITTSPEKYHLLKQVLDDTIRFISSIRLISRKKH